ncbi:SIMPL domain-containing protein [Aliidiomarina indica]|uniref:SIMPL domain-containing protein n=1 Tax=Aliidiomarina indica TaxID=2749147 RepID=UPI00188EC0E4|nr:SIMPL domain-containing protein [Aliidiomarina indica]
MFRLIFAALLCCVPLVATASSLPSFPFVTVSGESERGVMPDEAILTFQIVTFHAESEQASAQLNRTTREALQVLADNDIPDRAITSYEISKNEVRERDSSYNQLGIIGYQFRRNFQVELVDLDKYSAVVLALLDIDHLTFQHSSFDSSQRQAVELELIAEAAAAAKEKAEQMAQGLGVSIDSVFAFNDTGSFEEFFATFGLNQTVYSEMRMRTSAPPPSVDQELFIPESIRIYKRVNVIYKINP